MRHSAVWNKNLIVILAALQLHAIPIRRNGNEIGNLNLEAALLTLEDNAPVRYVQDAAVGFILYIVCDISCPASVGVADILEKEARITGSVTSPNIPFPNNPFFIERLIDVVALLTALQKNAVCVQNRQAATHDLVYSRNRKYGLYRWHLRFE